MKFQGQFFDTETSLHYNRFRYYDSDVGMFIQRDPIGLLGGNNVFAYAPNPIHWVDVLGLDVHHIIPNAVYKKFRKQLKGLSDENGNRYVQNKGKTAEDKSNLINLDTPFHGNHPEYNKYVTDELQKLKDNKVFTLENVKKLQADLVDKINLAKSEFPITGKNLNDYFKDLNGKKCSK